jgi:hypothetical protein
VKEGEGKGKKTGVEAGEQPIADHGVAVQTDCVLRCDVFLAGKNRQGELTSVDGFAESESTH